MDLYGRPAPRRTSTPAVVFLNERPKAQSFSSGFTPPGTGRGRGEDEDSSTFLPDRPGSNQLQHSLHQRPTSSRFLNRPQSSGVRRPERVYAQEAKQRPRDGKRAPTINIFAKRTTCFTQDSDSARSLEVDDADVADSALSSLDEQYLQQLKSDILHLHHIRTQLEKVMQAKEGDRPLRISSIAAPQAPNHVKHLLHHRDIKAVSGCGSQRNMDLKTDSDAAATTASIQTQLLRYNYSTDPAQLAAAKIGLEGLLAETLICLMEFCLAHDKFEHSGSDTRPSDENSNAFKMELVRPPTSQQHGEASSLPFANGCGISPVSIYAGGIISILQKTEIFKRTILACTGEKKILVKMIADKDAQINHLTEQIGFFKDVLARRQPRFESAKRVPVSFEQNDGHEPTTNESTPNANLLKAAQAAEQLARVTELEHERLESLESIHTLKQHNDGLGQQLEKTSFELQAALNRLETMEQLHRESMEATTKSLQEQVVSVEKHATDLQSSLTSTVERYRALENSTSQERAQLRHDKQELERLIRLKEDEATQRQAQAEVRADKQDQLNATQMKLVTQQLNQAQKMLGDLRVKMNAVQADNKKAQDTSHTLRQELKERNKDIETLSSKLMVINTTAESKTAMLQQSEARIVASTEEIQRQQALLEQHATQVHELEAKLSRSIPVDDEELQSRQQREESTWHQRVAALEHALVAERQNTALFQEQQRKAVAMEQEKAAHADEQAQAVVEELTTANLCLSERKRQREQEQRAFEEKLNELTDQTATLASEKEALERELDISRRMKDQAAEECTAMEKALREELALVNEELKSLSEIRVNLDRALAHALSSPRNKKPRHQASLSEVRAELQKAKQKIGALEEQLSSNCSIRTSEIDGKLAQLSARERRFAEDQRGLKKQRADVTAECRQSQKERAELDQQRESQQAAASKQEDDHDLLRQIIVLLAKRLQVLMELFSADERSSLPDHQIKTATPIGDSADKWCKLQEQWTALQQELEDVDWQLLSMRDRLEALHLEYAGYPLERSSLLSGFHGPNPFSDAVAAGQDTVPVADQLKASRLLRRLSCPGESLESRARQVKVEEHETFALALTREMTAMKDSYEWQLEQLRAELRKTQQLRMETSQRLRAELAAQRNRSERAIAELTERLAELEAASVAREKALAVKQAQHMALLELHAAANSDDERLRALNELAELVGSEQRRRERDRLAKLHTYCGASSVTVATRDRALEEETRAAALEQAS